MSAVPTTFGKYFLTEKIATGGMAEIYLAKLLGPGGFEKQLIIKQILPAFGDRREFVELFVQEAKTLVSLSHGNIVPIYELGVLEGTYFIAMEYIDGPTLAQLLEAAPARGQRIAPPTAAYICAELLKGLDYAHRKGAGVIHRDLSPRNVMLSREGEVKLVDFGIAGTVDDNLAGDGSDGAPVGSFPYMSPEQVRRERLTPATDLFSAGILLWETLTGKPLFTRQDADATLRAVLDAEIPPPSMVDPTVPEALDAVCIKALQRDPAERYASAGDFHARLTRYLYTVEPPVTPAGLSALVARACPPERRRRAGSHADPAAPVPPPGDGTAPMPGRGKPRGETRTFATHIQLDEVLENATPLFPMQAIVDDGAEARPEAPPRRETAEQQAAPPALEAEPAPPSRWTRIAAFATVAVLAAAAFAVLNRGEQPRARPALVAAAADAAPPDAPPPPLPAPPIDAAPVSPPDATPPPSHSDTTRPTRRKTGILKVGANPWGDVFVDGNKLGTAPGEWSVPAGTHEVVVRFTGLDGQEQTRRYTLTVAPDAVTSAPYSNFIAE